MTTTLAPRYADELASLFASDRRDWRRGLAVPGPRPELAPVAVLDGAVIAKTIYDLSALSSDDRWDYLAEQGYTAAELDGVSRMMTVWLGPASQAELMDLTNRHSDISPDALLANWLDAGHLEALYRLVASYEFPSPIPVLCYATVDAFVMACVAVRLADIRRKRASRPTTNWTSGRPEDFEEDLRWAEAGYDEEVLLWPEY